MKTTELKISKWSGFSHYQMHDHFVSGSIEAPAWMPDFSVSDFHDSKYLRSYKCTLLRAVLNCTNLTSLCTLVINLFTDIRKNHSICKYLYVSLIIFSSLINRNLKLERQEVKHKCIDSIKTIDMCIICYIVCEHDFCVIKIILGNN